MRIPVVREFEIGIPGTLHSFRVETDNRDISVGVFWRGLQAWEPTLGRVLLELGRRSATFFDVGANVGLASLLVAASSPPTRVHAFEPVPQIFERLRRNVEVNPGFTNVVLHQLALSNTSGEAVMHVPLDEWGRVPTEASLGPRSQVSQDAATRVETLDNIVQQHAIDRVDLVKIDTEGTEHWVLEGARETLARDRPFVVCEVLANWLEPDLAPIFSDLGYRAIHLRETGPEPCTEIRGDPTYRDLDFLFVPSERWPDLPPWLRPDP